MHPELLSEPVWREDIERELEYAREGCRNLYQFVERVQAQGAPTELVQGLWAAYASVYQSWQQLNVLLPCFSPEPTGR